ncbi:MAG: Rne/Rng family ribonuclease [Pseudorhodoplanes sp.]|nr:Rne/Rng family ribonuclease [Pseudorhodoplanes sp.]
MANKMLIDANHPEETRVVVLRGNRVEEFDFENAARKQLRGNIYLAKVTRVEPSLQAAFVDYGGNRHGFLAFSEIHPDYYQIPVADRQALIEEEQRAQREEDDEERNGRRRGRNRHRGADRKRGREDIVRSDVIAAGQAGEAAETSSAEAAPEGEAVAGQPAETTTLAADIVEPAMEDEPLPSPEESASPEERDEEDEEEDEGEEEEEEEEEEEDDEDDNDDEEEDDEEEDDENGQRAEARDAAVEFPASEARSDFEHATVAPASGDAGEGDNGARDGEAAFGTSGNGHAEEAPQEEDVVESVGGDADVTDEVPDRTRRFRRQYKIQEVIKRRQVMLVQVVKEERGSKGAALTTYLSLAGRYSVLMPNTARGGGISRKVTNAEDRRRMKEIAEELEVPEGMGVILRTAGANRSNAEIKRDFEYLLRLWETVRDLTLKSQAPTLVYEEGSLIKRSIRDLFHKDIDEIVVEGDAAYQEAKEFMRMLMPSHVQNVVAYRDTQPIFTRYGIETQLDAMFSPTVQLKSGGYIVINQAEALVAIDVNSGRATREHSIEETALKTNSEAAVEIARQLRLRDLAGLIVIDFIDMDEKRNNRTVERKLKEALKDDRARIQVGRISHFGLLEMSRQRIRASVLESSTEICPHCGGTGHMRSVSSVALQLLRALDEALMKGATHNLIVRTRSDVAIYVLNHKRAHLRDLEERYRVTITVTTDPTMTGLPAYAIDRGEQVLSAEQARALTVRYEQSLPRPPEDEEEPGEPGAIAPEGETEETEFAGSENEPRGNDGRRRRRGRRGGRGRHRRDERGAPAEGADAQAAPGEAGEDFELEAGRGDAEDMDAAPERGEHSERGERGEEDGGRRRRRGRRGGRRNRGEGRDQSGPQGPEGREEFAVAAEENPAGREPRHIPVRTESPPSFEPAPAASAPVSPPEPVMREAPRRRSTIREPAPVLDSGTGSAVFTPPPPPPAPQPEPVAQPAEAAETDRPRRFGWWSKRG